MFEPVLDHHREAYARYERNKRWSFAVGLFVMLFVGIVIVLIGAVDWLVWAMLLGLGGIAVALGWFEARKTLVFRRDLRERRGDSE